MWCTRWFLPLLLLPLPTAPPYFLLLFIFSLTVHAKPCFYCIVLISSIFVSSCYWQPFSLDTSLATPWADNVTTYGDALRSVLPSDVTNATATLPSSIRAVDRCWCDMSSGSFFDSFNVTRWEHNTVTRLKNDIEGQHRSTISANGTTGATIDAPRITNIASSFWSLFARSRKNISEKTEPPAEEEPLSEALSSEPEVMGHKYDLNTYGVNMVLDFGWSD